MDFIESALNNPYTYKIKVLDVHVNKEIYQPKQYRYLGGVIRTNIIRLMIMGIGIIKSIYNILKHGMHRLLTKDLI